MKLVEQKAELYFETNPYLKVARAGKTCYQSMKDLETVDGAKRFCQTALKNKHYSIFEHLNLVFVFNDTDCWGSFQNCKRELANSEIKRPHNVTDVWKTDTGIISINFRFLMEMYHGGLCLIDPMVQAVYKRWGDLFLDSEMFIKDSDVKVYTAEEFYEKFFLKGKLNKEEIEKHISFTFICDTDRAVMAELTRHRLNAFSCSSTRYINFDKKYGGLPIVKQPKPFTDMELVTLEKIEDCYAHMIKTGERAEVARNILPNVLWTQITTTANVAQWNNVFELRTAQAAHPQIRDLATQIQVKVNEALGKAE